ncbi:MAG: hypothetical protein HFG46_12090 [Clostridium sp.]|nr:hypothetical protein [Clostridium sp.]
MRKVVILITEVVLPIAVAIVLAAVFRTVYVSEDGCNFLWLWIVVGFPFGITRINNCSKVITEKSRPQGTALIIPPAQAAI